MALLEPEAYLIAKAEGRDILAVLAERENVAIERYGSQLQEANKRRAVEEAYRALPPAHSHRPDRLSEYAATKE